MCLRLHLPVSGHPRRWQTSGHAHCVWSLEAYRTSSSNHKNSLHLGLGTNPGLCTELRAQACLGLPGEAPSDNCQVITSLAAPGARELGGPGQRGSSYPGLCPAAEPVRVGRRHRPCPLLGPQRGRLRSAAALLASPRVLQRPHSSRRGRSPSTSSRLWSPPGSAFSSSSLAAPTRPRSWHLQGPRALKLRPEWPDPNPSNHLIRPRTPPEGPAP